MQVHFISSDFVTDASGARNLERKPMQQVFNQFLQFLQQGIAAILNFVQLVWMWSVGQITSLLSVPWHSWPLWRQVLLVLIAGGVVWALYRAAMELWEAGARVLTAFATLLIALVNTLPNILIAGVVALGGIWALNNLDFSSVRMPAALSWAQSER
jgi:hypothetical protein